MMSFNVVFKDVLTGCSYHFLEIFIYVSMYSVVIINFIPYIDKKY